MRGPGGRSGSGPKPRRAKRRWHLEEKQLWPERPLSRSTRIRSRRRQAGRIPSHGQEAGFPGEARVEGRPIDTEAGGHCRRTESGPAEERTGPSRPRRDRRPRRSSPMRMLLRRSSLRRRRLPALHTAVYDVARRCGRPARGPRSRLARLNPLHEPPCWQASLASDAYPPTPTRGGALSSRLTEMKRMWGQQPKRRKCEP